MKKTIVRSLVIIFSVLLTSSCASIVKGRHQEVSFQSTPDNATVLIDGRTIGKTPLTVVLAKKTGQIVIVEKEGYKPFTFSLETRTSGWFWGNILIGGFLGTTTDSVTGSVYEYSPSQYMVTLQQIASNPVSAPSTKSRDERVKEFIIVAYTNIRSDLNAGNGPYISSLLSLLNVPQENSEEAAKTVKLIASNYPNILDFADEVIRMFPEKS